MTKYLKKLLSLVLCAAILLQLLAVPASAAKPLYESEFNIRFGILQNELMSDTETLDAINELGRAVVIISVSDGKNKAKVFYSSTTSLSQSLLKASEKARGSGVMPKWLRLDVAVSSETMSYAQFQEQNIGQRTNILRSGVSFNNYFGTLLTEGQINAAGMVSNETGKFDLGKVNKELSAMKKKQISAIPDKLYLFKTQGYFTDNSAFAYKLLNGTYMSTGRRGVSISRDYLESLAYKTSSYFTSICGDNGKFIYGYYPIDNEEIEGYNIIRHAGTVWDLIMLYEMTRNESLVPVIDSAMDYLTRYVQYKDSKTAFVIDGNTLNLGGNGLSLLAYCQYAETFGSEKYNKVIEALANGVLFMQKDDGGFVHAINKENYGVERDYIVIFYDGEAMYGILRAYGLLGKYKYLTSARRAADYFIDNNYETEHSHWISYGFNELTKYDTSEKYFTFGLKNVNEDEYTKKAYNTITAAHATNETLGAAFELYDRLVTGGYKCDYLANFDAEMLIKAIRRRTIYGQNYFMFPECAMYFENPRSVVNSFAVREDNFRIRIDDIQHFMDGYYLFWKNFDRITGYEQKAETTEKTDKTAKSDKTEKNNSN